MKNKEDKILKEIFEIHKRKLKHLNVEHRKLIICFSGIPCTGKTMLAKVLEKKYRGVRISTNELRRTIRRLGKQRYPKLLDEIYKEEVLHEYLYGLLERYPFRNKLIILDKGIDRDHGKVSGRAKKEGFRIFVVRIKAGKKEAEKGLAKKTKRLDKNFVNNIDRWVQEYEEFGKVRKPDFEVRSVIGKPFETKGLFRKLDGIIR